jgi:hypothetical protein
VAVLPRKGERPESAGQRTTRAGSHRTFGEWLGVISTGFPIHRGERQAKEIPIFQIRNDDKRLKSQPKKLVE